MGNGAISTKLIKNRLIWSSFSTKIYKLMKIIDFLPAPINIKLIDTSSLFIKQCFQEEAMFWQRRGRLKFHKDLLNYFYYHAYVFLLYFYVYSFLKIKLCYFVTLSVGFIPVLGNKTGIRLGLNLKSFLLLHLFMCKVIKYRMRQWEPKSVKNL